MAKRRRESRRLSVSAERRRHILDGDATGGGHGPGRGISGKSEFPAALTDDQIILGVERILNDRKKYPNGIVPREGSPIVLKGDILGVPTIVIADPANGAVKTAWPEGVARNPVKQ